VLDWIGLGWVGLDWIGLDSIQLDWIGLDWIGLVMMYSSTLSCNSICVEDNKKSKGGFGAVVRIHISTDAWQ
jgi:hypothetical protein